MFEFILGVLILLTVIVTSPIIFGSRIRIGKETLEKIETELVSEKNKSNTYTNTFTINQLTEKKDDTVKNIQTLVLARRIISIGGTILAAILIICSMLAIVPTGYTGIKTTFGKVENDTLSSGINLKLPWQNVVNMDNREQRSGFAMQAFSKDIQQVDIQGSINLNIDKTTAMDLYRNVGIDYPTILVGPRVQEDVKIVIAKYTAENLVENRQRASDEIFELVKSELSEKGINVISFAIENLDFTDAFESAVEAKQVATQEKQKAQTEQEKMTMEMQQKAERDRIQAQAAADVQKIDADAKAYAVKVQADAEAEANRKVAETLSDKLIQYNTIHQWDGKLPTVQSGEYSTPIIDLRNTVE